MKNLQRSERRGGFRLNARRPTLYTHPLIPKCVRLTQEQIDHLIGISEESTDKPSVSDGVRRLIENSILSREGI